MRIIKSKLVAFKATPAEKFLLEEMAQSQGLDLSKFLRSAVFSQFPQKTKAA